MKRLFLAFVATTLLFAEDRVGIGSRPISQEALEQLTAEAPIEEDLSSLPESSGFFHRSPSSHWLACLVSEGVELEDGSVWRISDRSLNSVYFWQRFDPLVITQNRSWFSPYKYRIINRNHGVSVPADLLLSPVLDNENTRFIAAIDVNHGELVLTDGTRWVVSERDDLVLRDWLLHDVISVGINSGWDSGYDQILINSNMDNFVRARQF